MLSSYKLSEHEQDQDLWMGILIYKGRPSCQDQDMAQKT